MQQACHNAQPALCCHNFPSCSCHPRSLHVLSRSRSSNPLSSNQISPKALGAIQISRNEDQSGYPERTPNIISNLSSHAELARSPDEQALQDSRFDTTPYLTPSSILGYLTLSYAITVVKHFVFRVLARLFHGRYLAPIPVPATPLPQFHTLNETAVPLHTPRNKPTPLPIDSTEPNATGVNQSCPATPSSAFTTESNYEDKQLRAQWASLTRPVEARELSHKVIACGAVLFSWDGIIPGRTTRGYQSRKGAFVNICNIVNDEWVLVHENTCMYMPRAFIQIEEIGRAPSRQLCGTSNKAHSSKHQLPPSLTKTSLRNVLLQDLAQRISLISAKDVVLAGLRETPKRPPIPPAPFPREPSDQDHSGNRVTVSTDCRPSRDGSGTIVKFTFTMVPGPQSRFTSLVFNVQLPNGQKIVGTFPERVVSGCTDIQQNQSKGREVDVSVSGNYVGSGLRLGFKGTRSQEAGYTRTTKSEIRGGGRCSDNATWVATEDIAAGSGLDHKLKFSIMLPTNSPPPEIKCRYELRAVKQRGIEAKSKARNFTHRWNVDFPPEASA